MSLYLLLILLLTQTKAEIAKTEREKLLNETEKSFNDEKYNPLKELNLINEEDIPFKYDILKITEILEQYNFTQNYSFFEDMNLEPKIQTQGTCDSSWSFASTTALSYRFLKKEKKVELSHEEPFSSLNKQCGENHSAIGSQLYLIKNGTINEKCNPTSNQNCFEKFYSKNAYTIEPVYDEEHYYDYVKIIIDQLINHGPVVSSILVYEDFNSGSFCNKDVYSYDGESNFIGKQDVVIVGYGLYNDKYYWLIQNSLGSNWCEDGLAKIEFGQVGIESVSFSEPYIKGEYNETQDVTIDLKNTVERTKCFINFNTDSPNEDIKSNFELIFKNKKNEDKIYYYCGVVPLIDEDSHICLNDLNDSISEGSYEVYNSSSLGKENEFSINNEYNFYLNKDHFRTILINNKNKKLYVSESGSKILIESYNCEECLFKTKIYPNLKASFPLQNCQKINITNLERNYKYYLVSCVINENELNYFDYSYNNENNAVMAYDKLCGVKTKIDATIYKLDKTKYPVLRINDFKIPKKDNFDNGSEFTLIADVEGSISGFTSSSEQFYVFIDISYNNQIKTYELYCTPKDIKIVKNYEINCHFVQIVNLINYDYVILYPYSYQLDTQPYEIIISKTFYVDKQNNQTDYNTDNTDNTDDYDDSDDFIPCINCSSSSGSGLGAGWIVLIVLGGIAVVGGITYAVVKK